MFISVSQINLALRCQREWIFKYVLKYPEASSDNLIIGRVWHSLAEGKPLSSCDIEGLPAEFPWGAYFRRMLAGYAIERKKYAPTFAHELAWLKEDEFKLIIDEIAMNDSGKWWIIERKTRSQDLGIKRQMLGSDLQLGLYAAYRREYANEFWLDPSQYQGCIYIATYKPNQKRLKSRKKDSKGEWAETTDQWGERMTSSTESVLVTDVDERGALATRDFGLKVIEYTQNAYEKYRDWRPIPSRSESCIRYGKPCPFFTNCHGRYEK